MDTISFLIMTPEISQSDLAGFCDERVNLKREHADAYREQINNLREHLDRYIEEHPDVGLVKMQLSGSLAKGTALSTIQDVEFPWGAKLFTPSATHERRSFCFR